LAGSGILERLVGLGLAEGDDELPERFKADRRSTTVNCMRVLDRPRDQGSVAKVGRLRPIHLLAAFVHPHAVDQVRLMAGVSLAIGHGAPEQL